MTLSDLISIKNEMQFRETCNDYLACIGTGTSRDVYRLNNRQVIKVAKHDYGYAQNASECDVFNAYGSLGFLNEVTKNADSYLWVIQPLAEPLSDHDECLSKIVDMVEHIERSKEYVANDAYFKMVYDFLVETEWKYLYDIKKQDSWGRVNGELKLIDYGMNNEAIEEYLV